MFSILWRGDRASAAKALCQHRPMIYGLNDDRSSCGRYRKNIQTTDAAFNNATKNLENLSAVPPRLPGALTKGERPFRRSRTKMAAVR
jgi:hypothetical protein